MVNKRTVLVFTLTAALAGSASTALAADSSVTRRAAKSPVAISHAPQLSGPTTALFRAGGRLLNVFRAISGLGVVDLPTRGGVFQLDTIQDAPDGVDPLGVKGQRLPGDGGPTPGWTTSH